MQISSNSPTFSDNLNGDRAAALTQTEERYKTLVANIPGAVYRCVCEVAAQGTRPKWAVVFLSDAIFNIAGYPSSDFIRDRVRSFASIIHPQDRAKVEAVVSKSLETKNPYIIEYRIVRADGAIAWVYEKGQCVCKEEEAEQGDEGSLERRRAQEGESGGARNETISSTFYLDGVILDITERKSAEENLRHAQEFLNAVLKNLPVGIFIKDAIEQRFMYWNTASEELFGYSREEALGKTDCELFSLTDAAYLQAQDRQVLETGKGVDIPEEKIQIPSRGERILHTKKVPLFDDETGKAKYILGISQDITERKQIEVALRESENHYRCIVETASEGVWMFDADSKITFANNRIAEMLGYNVDEMQGRSLFEFMDNDSEAIARNYVERRRQGIQERHDFKFTRRDGSHLWAIVSATPMFNSDGEFAGVLRMITDISDVYNQLRLREQAEAELRKTLKELEYEKFALDQSAIVAITNDRGVITYVNDQFCEISKYTRQELIGKTHKIVNSSYHPQTFFQNLWSTISQGKVWRGEIKNKAKDGTCYWVDTTIVPFLNLSGEPYQYVAIRNNITDRKQVEEALRESESELRVKNQQIAKALRDWQQTQSMMVQNEKMVSLGQLVAGVAHEINNPVSFIYGNVMHAEAYFQDLLKMVQIYQQEYPEPTAVVQEGIDDLDLKFLLKDLPKLLNSMKIGADRIHQIVRSLKNFSRLDEADRKQVDIHEGIESTLLILQHRFKETAGHPKIVLIKEYGQIPRFQCYAGQLNQVFMNIIGNSLDALEEAMETGNWTVAELSPLTYCPSPTIKISTEFVSNQESIEQVVIRISDNGPGIPAEVQQRLFDPFFTTKNPGKGTGLGLSISYQIVVEKHGGQLKCISAPGQGAEFVIEIPFIKSRGLL